MSGTFKSQLLQKDRCDNEHPCTKGTLTGDLSGEYTFTKKKDLPVKVKHLPRDVKNTVASVGFYVGESIVTLTNGNVVLKGIDTGALDGHRGALASLITWTGGTGAMQKATGQIRVRGELNPKEGVFTGDYVGTLCGG